MVPAHPLVGIGGALAIVDFLVLAFILVFRLLALCRVEACILFNAGSTKVKGESWLWDGL